MPTKRARSSFRMSYDGAGPTMTRAEAQRLTHEWQNTMEAIRRLHRQEMALILAHQRASAADQALIAKDLQSLRRDLVRAQQRSEQLENQIEQAQIEGLEEPYPPRPGMLNIEDVED